MINNHSNTLLCNVRIGCNILPNKAALNSYQILEKGMLYIFLFCLSLYPEKKTCNFCCTVTPPTIAFSCISWVLDSKK